MALVCRVEEPSTASDSDTIASVADQFETDITTPGNDSVKNKSFRASSLRGSRETQVLRMIGGVGAPPTRQDLIDVQRAEARRRPLHHGRVDLGDLDVERGDPMTDGSLRRGASRSRRVLSPPCGAAQAMAAAWRSARAGRAASPTREGHVPDRDSGVACRPPVGCRRLPLASQRESARRSTSPSSSPEAFALSWCLCGII
jgi:hypothetical protein